MALFLEFPGPAGTLLVPLDTPRATIGGPACDIPIEGADREWALVEIHDGRASIRRRAGAPSLRVGGLETEEAALVAGIEGSIGEARFRVLAEISPIEKASPTRESSPPGETLASDVALAAAAVASGLADPATVRRWREAVAEGKGSYAWREATREILGATPAGDALLGAAIRLERDALASAPRRRASLAAKKAAAFAVSHFLVLMVYSVIVVAVLFLLKGGVGFDLYRLLGL